MFTPKGRVITLPAGSTTVDFAYAVHTEVGHACVGSKVNGRLVSLDHQLTSGDTCEIFTSKVETAGPSQDWLAFVRSPRARNKIRQWFSRERRGDMIENGPRGAHRRVPPRGPAGAADVDVGPAQDRHPRPQLRRSRLPAGGDRRAPRVGARRRPAGGPRPPRRRERRHRAAAGDGAAAAPPPHPGRQRRPARRGPRRRPRPPRRLLHAGARRRGHRLHHPRPRRQRAPRRLRQRRRPARPSRRRG